MEIVLTKMLFILLMILPAVFAKNCSYYYDGMAYARSVVFTIKGLPMDLVYNPFNKDLYFTLVDLESLQDDNVQTIMDQYILRNNEAIKVDNIKGQSAAIDIDTNKVYLAADDGLYFLNQSNKAQFISNKNEDIIQLFKPKKTNEIYIIQHPKLDVYVIDLAENEKRQVENIPCARLFAVDNEGNIYYECEDKHVKMLLKGFVEPIQFVGLANDSAQIIVIDSYDRAIVATDDGLYRLTPTSLIPYKMMDLDYTPVGIVFDGADIYISTLDVIYKYTNENCDVTKF